MKWECSKLIKWNKLTAAFFGFQSCHTCKIHWNKKQKEHFCNFQEQFSFLFLKIGIFYQKKEEKRCLSENFLEDFGYICNFNTPAYHELPQVFLFSNGTSVLLLPGYYRIFRFDNILIIEQHCQQNVGYLFF